MKFAFIADVPGWALHRQGLGLVKYGGVDGHTWDVFFLDPIDVSVEILQSYDAIRLGAAPHLHHAEVHDWLPNGPKLIVSMASFRDEKKYHKGIKAYLDLIDGFQVVDQRLLATCAGYQRPAFHLTDGTDPAMYYPQEDLRTTSGPLRVGWAGSTEYWGPQVKNVAAIEEACARVDGVVFVRQDRELDGTLGMQRMREWFNGLDLYISANAIATPTPVPCLEAASCGVSVLTTRCGELWPLLESHQAAWLIKSPHVGNIEAGLCRAVSDGRETLHQRGLAFARRYHRFLHWGPGTREFTRWVAAVCKGS